MKTVSFMVMNIQFKIHRLRIVHVVDLTHIGHNVNCLVSTPDRDGIDSVGHLWFVSHLGRGASLPSSPNY